MRLLTRKFHAELAKDAKIASAVSALKELSFFRTPTHCSGEERENPRLK
jgi:hypothetical protein